MFGVFLVLFPFFQAVLGWSALRSAAAMLPMTRRDDADVDDRASRSPAGSARRNTMAAGVAIFAAGLALMALRASVEGGYLSVLPGLIVIGLGMGLTMTPATEAITETLPLEKQGVASALNDTSRELGGAVGIALLGSVLTAGYKSAIEPLLAGVPAELAEPASEGIGAAFAVAASAGEQGPTIIDAAQARVRRRLDRLDVARRRHGGRRARLPRAPRPQVCCRRARRRDSGRDGARAGRLTMDPVHDQGPEPSSATPIDGFVAPGWEPVREAFAANFSERGDLGAGVAVYRRGRLVVDLVGGHRDRDRSEPYDRDTLQLIFSSTKGVTSACVAVCVERGWLDPAADVRSLWPALPADVTVEQLMSHQAGLITIEPPLTLAQCLDSSTALRALEATAPAWEPGSRHGYHAITFGWLAGELVRLADPRHRPLGRFLREEIAAPLGLRMWIGLPDEEQPRVARLVGAPPPEDPEERAFLAARVARGTLAERALTVSGALPMVGKGLPWNKPEVRAAEFGGANAVTDARSLAKLYGAMVAEVDGVRLTSDRTLDVVRRPRVSGPDACIGAEMSFGMGFMLHTGFNPLLGPGSFGHPGAGGSLGFADAESGIGFGYVMNQMRTGLAADARPAALIDAVRTSLASAD